MGRCHTKLNETAGVKYTAI